MSMATCSPALAAGDRVRMKDAPEETGWVTSHPSGRENPGGLVEIDWESGGWTREEPGDLEVRVSWSEGWQPVSDRERSAA